MSALKILVIPGSLRTGSLNARLAAVAAHELAQSGAEVTRISLADYPLPIYDGDLQAKSGVPKHAVNLKRMMSAHHGILIVTPEYNSSVPPLVNTFIGTVVHMVALPLYILTLGLLALIVNGLLLMLVAWVSSLMGFGLVVDDFWWGVFGAFVLGIAGWLLGIIVRPVTPRR